MGPKKKIPNPFAILKIGIVIGVLTSLLGWTFFDTINILIDKQLLKMGIESPLAGNALIIILIVAIFILGGRNDKIKAALEE